MAASLAAAKRRRAPGAVNTGAAFQTTPQRPVAGPPKTSITPEIAIKMIGSRVGSLEQFTRTNLEAVEKKFGEQDKFLVESFSTVPDIEQVNGAFDDLDKRVGEVEKSAAVVDLDKRVGEVVTSTTSLITAHKAQIAASVADLEKRISVAAHPPAVSELQKRVSEIENSSSLTELVNRVNKVEKSSDEGFANLEKRVNNIEKSSILTDLEKRVTETEETATRSSKIEVDLDAKITALEQKFAQLEDLEKRLTKMENNNSSSNKKKNNKQDLYE